MKIFKNIITKEGRRYQISWQWRTQNHNLLENYNSYLSVLRKIATYFNALKNNKTSTEQRNHWKGGKGNSI